MNLYNLLQKLTHERTLKFTVQTFPSNTSTYILSRIAIYILRSIALFMEIILSAHFISEVKRSITVKVLLSSVLVLNRRTSSVISNWFMPSEFIVLSNSPLLRGCIRILEDEEAIL